MAMDAFATIPNNTGEKNNYNEEPRIYRQFLQRILITGQTRLNGLAVGDYFVFAMLLQGCTTAIPSILLGGSI